MIEIRLELIMIVVRNIMIESNRVNFYIVFLMIVLGRIKPRIPE